MNKEELLNFLDDADIRQKILEIVAGENPAEENLRDVVAEKNSALAKISALEKNLRDVTNEKNSAQNQLQTARVEIYQLKSDLSKAAQREKNYQAESVELEQQISRLQKSYSDLQKKFADFERGWRLFQDYQRVGAHARQILDSGVFPRNNFLAFICGGAQANSLEIIWDVVRDCALSGDNSDAKILWQIFEFCIELVNSSRAQASYQILPVQAGDRFDPDFQLEGPNSRSQGYISAVLIRGFQNNYNCRVIRKSIVQVS